MNGAVLFDLNGTLADTETAFYLAYREVLAKHNVPFTIEQFTENWSIKGKKLPDFLEQIARTDLLELSEQLLAEKDRIFQRSLDERIEAISGAASYVETLHSAGIALGLDSSTTRANIDRIISLVALDGHFLAISSGDMELDSEHYGPVKKKSSRLTWLADQLGYPTERCVVIGDAEKDISGARQAGMRAIAVPNRFTKNNDFSRAETVYRSFAALAEGGPAVLANVIAQ